MAIFIFLLMIIGKGKTLITRNKIRIGILFIVHLLIITKFPLFQFIKFLVFRSDNLQQPQQQEKNGFPASNLQITNGFCFLVVEIAYFVVFRFAVIHNSFHWFRTSFIYSYRFY